MADYPRKRASIACDVCRTRRTKCDGEKPRCGFCRSADAECVYRQAPEPAPSKLEAEITTIRERLDHITTLLGDRHQTSLPSIQPVLELSARHGLHDSQSPRSTISRTNGDTDTDDPNFPIIVIQCPSTMRLLSLDPDLGYRLSDLERSTPTPSRSSRPGLAKMFMLHPQRVASATAAFAENVHSWFPFLPKDFSESLTASLSGHGRSEADTCVAMLVLAIGSLAERGLVHVEEEPPDALYFDEALPLLPAVISDYSLPSLHSLILFSLYYLCLLRPCQAHDYILMASYKLQNMLKSTAGRGDDAAVHTDAVHRAYWAVLLIESELKVQLDMVGSGIERYEKKISLPVTDAIWHYYPVDQASTSSHLDGPYLLARAAMLRLRERCATSGGEFIDGHLQYAPEVAKELEQRLKEWFERLPSGLKSSRTQHRHGGTAMTTPRAVFLKTQYEACKTSIYWHAVYQAVERGTRSAETIRGCELFFTSYTSFMEAASVSLDSCLPGAWAQSARYEAWSVAALEAEC